MSSCLVQEVLELSPPVLNHIVVKVLLAPDLPRQGPDCHARRFPLEDVAEVHEVGIPALDYGPVELEGGDVRFTDDGVEDVFGVLAFEDDFRIFDLFVPRG